ncbi:MAG: hypothetical protein HOP17_07060, partial [Acidobacteria bacterium]|nr:hypothetical protein [Acidobacteriota bacterium]
IFVFVFCLFLQELHAQRQSYLIAPQTTDPSISTNLNNHYVSINRGLTPKNQLFVFLPGTGGVAINQREINHTAADLGFHAANLTYPNDEAVNSLCGGFSTDLDCYGNVRLETKDGTDRTALVTVNRANSIENRLIKVLIYLRDQFPADNWGQFLIDNTTINWSKIVVSGHSQGGGHAGIIGRYHSVVRVIMFAAMDFNGATQSPANWIALPNSTPNASSTDKFWAFSHQQDEQVNFSILSTRIWPAYGLPPFGSILNVDGASPPYGNTHSLTSDRVCDNFHGCVVVDARLVRENGIPVYKPVWEYLLSNTVSPLGLTSIEFLRAGSAVSRPPVGISTKYFRVRLQGSGFDANSRVLVNGIEMETEIVNVNELRSGLPPGKIGRVGGSAIQVRNQGGAISNILPF